MRRDVNAGQLPTFELAGIKHYVWPLMIFGYNNPLFIMQSLGVV